MLESSILARAALSTGEAESVEPRSAIVANDRQARQSWADNRTRFVCRRARRPRVRDEDARNSSTSASVSRGGRH